MIRLVLLAALLLPACGARPLQCKSVKVSYWQDKNDKDYHYKASYQCTLPDETTQVVTPIKSKTRIPGCKQN